MTAGGSHIGMTAVDLVHPPDQPEFLEFFQRAVNGNQTDVGVAFARLDEDLVGRQGMSAFRYNHHDRFARTGKSVAAAGENVQPVVGVRLPGFGGLGWVKYSHLQLIIEGQLGLCQAARQNY